MDTRQYGTRDSQLQGRARPSPTRRADTTPLGPAPTPAPLPPTQRSLPLWLLVAAIFAGTGIALLTIPAWVPVLGASLVGDEPKATWYLSRASAFVAYVLLWVSMASGLLISNKMARIWPGAFTAFDLHQFTSLLGLGFALFHALVLLGNTYITYDLMQILVPFAATGYRPLETALGQIALYLSALVTFTFYVRKQIGHRTWYVIHLLSYLMFALALAHGIFSGTDTGNLWITGLYWGSGLSLLALTIHRMTIKRASAPAR